MAITCQEPASNTQPVVALKINTDHLGEEQERVQWELMKRIIGIGSRYLAEISPSRASSSPVWRQLENFQFCFGNWINIPQIMLLMAASKRSLHAVKVMVLSLNNRLFFLFFLVLNQKIPNSPRANEVIRGGGGGGVIILTFVFFLTNLRHCTKLCWGK